MRKKSDSGQASPKPPVDSPRPADIYSPPYDPLDDYNSPEFQKMYAEGSDALHSYTGRIWAAIEACPSGTPLLDRFAIIKKALDDEFSREPLPGGGGRSMTPRQNHIAYTELFVDQLLGQISDLILDTVPQLGKPRPANTNPAYDDGIVSEAFMLGGKIMRLSIEDPVLLLHRVLELIQRPKKPSKNRSRVDRQRKQWAMVQMEKLVPKMGQVDASKSVLAMLKKRDGTLKLKAATVRRWYNAYRKARTKGGRKDARA